MVPYSSESSCVKVEEMTVVPALIEDGELVALRKGLMQTPKQITELEEYYPYKTEIKMLRQHASSIVAQIPKGAKIVELGCGSASKTSILLREVLKRGSSRDGKEGCAFIGIDVSADFLDQAKENLVNSCPGLMPEHVEMIQASYLEGLRQARQRHPDDVLCILWLGSSIGNLDHLESQAFFREIMSISGLKTQVLVCTDLWKDRATLHQAYCDSQGVTEAFIKNGLRNAIQAVSYGQASVDLAEWEYEVLVNPDSRQVEMFVIARQSQSINGGISFHKGERVLMEVSRKFLPEQLRPLAYQAGFIFQIVWADTDRLFGLVKDWSAIPISLRHPFCFYYGHVAGFAKLKLYQSLPPTKIDNMFSRGIDPSVSDPSQCHSHPDIPCQWPPKSQIIQYAHEARQMVQSYFRKPDASMWLINIALEHECMHQETLYYMLAQNQKHTWEQAHLDSSGHLIARQNGAHQNGHTNGTPENGHSHVGVYMRENGRVLNGWHNKNGINLEENKLTQAQNGRHEKDIQTKGITEEALSNGSSLMFKHANGKGAVATEDCAWTHVPAGRVTLGVEINATKEFNWDNEGPPQAPRMVEAFKVATKAVSIEDFREFVLEGGYEKRELWSDEAYKCIASQQGAPATWTLTAGKEVYVHTPTETRHWEEIKRQAVWCSLAEAHAYCRHKGLQLLSELEYLRAADFDPSGRRIEDLKLNGWELTSTLMDPLEGFKPMSDYPEYSSDFYDGKHFVLRGSSPYTPPAVFRGSFRNFYQDIYPYHFAKFRCCTRLG